MRKNGEKINSLIFEKNDGIGTPNIRISIIAVHPIKNIIKMARNFGCL